MTKWVLHDTLVQCYKWAQLLYSLYLQNMAWKQEAVGWERLTMPSWLIFSLPTLCKAVFNFSSKCLPKWPSYFAFPSTVNERSCCFILLPTLGIVCVLDFSHCNTYVMVSSCFNLNFPHDMWGWKSLQNYANHAYIYFGEISVETFGTFLIQMLGFPLLNSRSSFFFFFHLFLLVVG